MSSKEISRLEVIQKLDEKRLSQKKASTILEVSVRQIKGLLKSHRRERAKRPISKHRGRRGKNRLRTEVKKKALDLLQSKYKCFGSTLAHEKLVEKENSRFRTKVSVST